MEPQRKQLTLKGINRSLPSLLSDGLYAHELINMRFKDAAWRAVGSKVAVDAEPITDHDEYTIIVAPPIIDNKYLVGYHAPFDDLELIDTSTGATSVISAYTGLVESIYFFGRLMIVKVPDDRLLFKVNETLDGYDLLPDIPEGQMSLWHTGEAMYNLPSESSKQKAVLAVSKKISEDRLIGRFEGHVFVRFAWRLWDNSLIQHSAVHYHHVGFSPEMMIMIEDGEDGGNFTVNNYKACAPRIGLSLDSKDIEALEKYKDVITGLAMFMSDPVSTYQSNINDYIRGWDAVYITNRLVEHRPLPRELENLFADVKGFYKVFEISRDDLIKQIEDLPSGETTVYKNLEIANVGAIETNELLPVDNFTNHKIFGEEYYDYNSRLHIGNVKTRFKTCYNLGKYPNWIEGNTEDEALRDSIYPGSGVYVDNPLFYGALDGIDIYAEVEIETVGGQRVTKRLLEYDEGMLIARRLGAAPSGFTTYFQGTTGSQYMLTLKEVLTYPDTRAKKFRMVMVVESTGVHRTIAEYELTAHPYLNISYSKPVVAHTGNKYYTPNYKAIKTDYTEHPVHTPFDDYNVPLPDTNRVQVSEVNNAFLYPAKYSYRIGPISNTVIKLATMSEPMSTGQYGDFPLNIFTSQGVFNLNKGNPDILYLNVSRQNLDVLLAKNALLELGGAVVYATNTGLFLLSGTQRKEISRAVEGGVDGIAGRTDRWKFPDESTCPDYFSEINFIQYMQAAIMAYDNNEMELHVINPAKAYSYVYQVEHDLWHKLKQSYEIVFRVDGGRFVGIDAGSNLTYLDAETYGNTPMNVCLLSRGEVFGNTGFKRIERFAARLIYMADKCYKMQMNLFASLDGREWKWIGGITVDDDSGKTWNDARYFLVSFGANVDQRFELSAFEADVVHKHVGKLR